MEEIKIILNDNIKFIIVAFIAYALDFITGFSRAVLEKNVQSSKLKKSIIKFIVYFAFIVMGGCAEILFPSESEHAFKLQAACCAIAATDFYSVYENNKDIFNLPIIKEFIDKLKNSDT